MTYAKIINGQLTYPTAEEFPGVCGWEQHGPALRGAGYLPLQGTADEREGYQAIPATWEVVNRTETRTEPRQVERDGHMTIEDVEVEVAASYINVLSWDYMEIPPAEPDTDPIDPTDPDLENLPKLFTKWELIQAWEGTGDINGVLAQARNDTNMLAAWSSLPEQIDMADLLTQWAQRVALYAGGRTVDKANIIKWLRWIKEHREAQS